MGKRRFEMYEYRQIIVRLRLGESIRGLVRAGLASRHKIRNIRKIAIHQNWLDAKCELPSDEELSRFFKQSQLSPVTQSSVLLYKPQIEEWCRQKIQASTIYAALKRE